MSSILVLSTEERNQALNNFQEYLRIRTVHPTPDYEGAVKFLFAQAKEMGLRCERLDVHPGKPVIVICWPGSNSSLRSLMLNSHTDVVPVYEDQWKLPPFAAKIDENGDIYARGTQDMKSVGSQYLEAVKKLVKSGYKPRRNVFLTFVPDEEIMGELGMGKFIEHDFFKKMNVGCCMDEGLANPSDKFTVFYGERSVLWLRVTAKGDPGHGSRLLNNTAGEKICKVLQKVDEFRRSQRQRLDREKEITLGEVTTVNLTTMSGGLQTNVIPAELTIQIDCRVAPNVDLKKFELELSSWCEAAGPDVTLDFVHKFNSHDYFTDFSSSNPWWCSFSSCCNDMGLTLVPEIFPAVTDSRYLRAIGIDAIGFAPMNHTPMKLHDHNELLNKDVFLKGIEYYTAILPAVIESDTD